MSHRQRIALLFLGFLAAPCAAEAPSSFPLKDGDIWVMAGDSITAQHLHSNYFEAFCFARYPKLKFAFRNSGVGGHTIPSTLARFDYDIAAWQPTVVSVELGMNDQGGTPTEKFITNMGMMVERIRSSKARPVILSASPINDGTTLAALGGGNKRLHEYALALKEFAAKEQVPYADQYHALLDIWGKNKPRELVANSMGAFKMIARDDSLAGVEQLRAFLEAQEKSPVKLVSMQGDPVHPGAPGQLMMAAALLKELGADGFVSSATLDAEGKVGGSKGCAISDGKAENGKLTFERTDERVPFPIPEEARAVLPLYPTILDLSQYTLKVTGLKEGSYVLKINDIPCATLSARELEAGVNLTSYGKHPQAKEAHPIGAQGQAILAAVAAKEGLVNQWRGLSRQAHAPGANASLKDQLAVLTGKVQEADAKIRDAAKPRKLHYELVGVGGFKPNKEPGGR
jgi:lysophospholipase L1-like esterase